jgi:excisionase family DNA binding protein
MSTPQTEARRLLAIAEVAEILGVDIRHVRRLVHERRIPYIKWGHLLRFDPDEITSWLNEHRHPDLPPRPGGHRAA